MLAVRIKKLTLLRLLCCLAVLVVMPGADVRAERKVNESLLRAVFVERFTRFIDWPADKKLDSIDSFALCVFNDSNFSEDLKAIYQKMKIKNKSTIVKNITQSQQAVECSLIYLPKISLELLEQMLVTAKAANALIVSEYEGYAELGVHINLYQVADKLRMEVNPSALKQAGFKVDSRLLRYAKIASEKGRQR